MLTAFAGGALFGERIGAGHASVLALHGWGRTHADFRALLDGFDAVALDLPGFGASPAPSTAWGAADYARAVTGVLPGLAPPVVVLGHSFGGRVGVELAARHPDAVAALVLTGVPLLRSGPPARPPLRFRAVRALHRQGLISDARMERLRRSRGSDDYRAASGVMREVFVRLVNESYDDALRSSRCPIELVWGDDDPQVPLVIAERAATIVGERARLTVVPGAGHDTPRTARDALRDALDRGLAARAARVDGAR